MTKLSGRSLWFSLRELNADTPIAQGVFFVNKDESVSCFGDHHSPKVMSGGEEICANIFEGVILEHQLRADGTIGLLMKIYVVEDDSSYPGGKRQVLLYRSAFCIGVNSGEPETERIMIGETHEVFINLKSVPEPLPLGYVTKNRESSES
ncbi:MAG: hypothetical protein AAF558_01055 [Verrucomicrobiota bacterium]